MTTLTTNPPELTAARERNEALWRQASGLLYDR